MAVDLLHLPDEILVLVLSYLNTSSSTTSPDAAVVSKPELCALALTCRRFSALTREQVFGCIALKHHNPHLWAIYSPGGPSYSYCDPKRRDGDRIKLLMRTWDQDQSLLLKRLQCVTWHTEFFDPSLREEFFDCLARSESLVKLNLASCSREDVRRLTIRIHSPARPSYFAKLRSLRIRPTDPNAIYSRLLSALCTAPMLRKLDVPAHSIATLDFDEMSSSRSSSNPSSKVLETLHIGPGSYVDITTYERILSRCTGLKQLSCPPPGPGIAFEQCGWRPYPEANCYNFISALVSQALLPLSQTLEDLSITDPDIIFSAQDQTCLDLSAFVRLRKLRISHAVLTGGHCSYYADKPLDVICKLLPPHLEQLHVAYDSLAGIFHSMESLEQIAVYPAHPIYSNLWNNGPGREGMISRSLRWVTEVAERKRQGQGLSQLRKIDLVESHTPRLLRQYGVGVGLRTLNLRLAHPKLFQEFVKAGIKIGLKIYVPNEWPDDISCSAHHTVREPS